ncbi:MAG: thioredoxin family protein [Candidatus Diapherotrites archaeon]|nr:thioredoxin family protein [Candidatus Diapherotrites archaeon]
MAMNMELFAGNCYLCSNTEKMIRRVMGPKCRLRTYNLAEGKNRRKAEKYGIRALPTIVGNGRKMFEGIPEYAELAKCSLEHGCKGKFLK